jgi:hypothetical protein
MKTRSTVIFSFHFYLITQTVIAPAVSTAFPAVSAGILMIRQHNQDKG